MALKNPLAGKTAFFARAIYVGERIDLKALETSNRLATSPTVIAAGERGLAALFRYGVVVLIDLNPLEENTFLENLKHLVSERFDQPKIESLDISVNPTKDEKLEDGVMALQSQSIERLQLISEILAKSAVLDRYESEIASIFARIEPLAAGLQKTGRSDYNPKELLKHIGGTLLIQHKMVWRVEADEKPEVLWEHPELERLFAHLENEYELRERVLALERKLELISRTVETALELLQHKHSLRVEWYIVILIIFEIALNIYEKYL